MRRTFLRTVAGVLSLLFIACNIKVTTPGDDQADTYLDPVSGLEWQAFGQELDSLDAATAHCALLTLAGHDDWRVPTIDEIRTLVRGCSHTMTGGACEVSDPNCLSNSCRASCYGCGDEDGPAPKGGFWDAEAEEAFVPEKKSIGNYCFWVSGSPVIDKKNEVWQFDFSSGEIYDDSYSFAALHCVRTATPLAVGDKCVAGLSFCRDNIAYNCVSGKLALTEECDVSDKVCYDDPTSGAQCVERPPAPVIGLKYALPFSGYKDHRVIKDPIIMDASLSCPMRDDLNEATAKKCRESIIVSSATPENTMTAADFAQQCCLPGWKDKYCLNFRWILAESPTPYTNETHIGLENMPAGGEGVWYSTCSGDDPTLASFKGLMITPTPDGKEYKVQIEAKTVDRVTGAESDSATKIDAPNIIPNARVMVQLTWKEGLQTRAQLDRQEGVAVDLDLHLVKKEGMNACGAEVGAAGLLCTQMGPPYMPEIASSTHDDCHFNDLGNNGRYEWTGCNGDYKTIAWHAALDLDNTWGGADYTSPEVIDLGPIDDAYPQDGQPDVRPFSDDYLLLVNYNRCQNLKDDDYSACMPGGENYNVHARIDIFIDGVRAPREGKDAATLTRADFVIRPREWIAVNLINWDQAKTGKWSGDAVVSNAPDTHQRACNFDLAYCHNVPIWDAVAYESWATDPMQTNDGTCYEYGTRQ